MLKEVNTALAITRSGRSSGLSISSAVISWVLLMKREAERKRLVLLENYQMQNSWLTWGLSDMMRKDLTWNKILTGYSEKLLKFVLNANLLTLATPDNLRRWKIASDVPCGLCSKPNVGLSHVLAGCPWVLKVENKFDHEIAIPGVIIVFFWL